MKRYYFYKRNQNFRAEYKGDLIDFSLSALYATREYSQKLGKDISQYHYFDQLELCISTKTPGIYKVNIDSGTDGCHGHFAKSQKELLKAFAGYSLISECEYFRLRKIALRLIFKHINFFKQNNPDIERNFYYQNDYSRNFYNLTVVSTSYKYNIKNYPQEQLDYMAKVDLALNDLRIDEYFKIFISKDPTYKTNTFSIESYHFNPNYKSQKDFLSGNFLSKNVQPVEIKNFQFSRLKRKIAEVLVERSSLDITAISARQKHNITILDI